MEVTAKYIFAEIFNIITYHLFQTHHTLYVTTYSKSNPPRATAAA